MNRPGNRKIVKEGSSDLKFQNFALPKNRSWPRNNSATGQYQTINEPLLDGERNSIAVLDGAKGHTDDDYEDPELRMVEDRQSVKILPARPIKESEYADTRYFKGMMDTPLSLDSKPSLPTDRQTWMKLEEHTSLRGVSLEELEAEGVMKEATAVTNPNPYLMLDCMDQQKSHIVCRQSYVVQCSTEEKRCKSPFPRISETNMLKETNPQRETRLLYHLLGRPSSFRRSTSPSPRSRRAASHLSPRGTPSMKPREGPVPYHQMKPEAPHLPQNQSPQEIPFAVTSSSFMTRNPTVQNRDHKESMPSYAPQRCQSPAGSGPQENPLLHKITSRRKPFPTRSDGKDVQHSEWYIGEYSRQAVEEALTKENKDGTFLVRDCSAKSRAEPYVLAVFYGNKVYNVKIRFLERNQQFALGTGLRGDEKFDSVEAIIEHYKYFPIILIDGKDKTGTHREQCYLTQALPVNRHFSPR